MDAKYPMTTGHCMSLQWICKLVCKSVCTVSQSKKPWLNHAVYIQTNLPEAVFHSPKIDFWFAVVLLTPPLLEGQFDSARQILNFSPTPPLDSSAARFRSHRSCWSGSSREDSVGVEGLRYTNSCLPSKRLLAVICDAKSRLLDSNSLHVLHVQYASLK